MQNASMMVRDSNVCVQQVSWDQLVLNVSWFFMLISQASLIVEMIIINNYSYCFAFKYL